MTAARLTIDLDALARNHARLVADSGAAEVAPVVKADGYGLGVGPVGRRLWTAGARSFFVARLAEGEDLRRELGDRAADILVLDGLGDLADAPRMAAARLTPVLNRVTEIEAWSQFTGASRAACALHIDTGMNRVGVDHERTGEAATALARAANLDLAFVMSHLSCAAEPDHPRNALQADRFDAARRAFPGVRSSFAASAGIYLGPRYLQDMTRPGISLFGGGPREVPDPRFEAVATLTAPVMAVRDLAAGESAGYGRMFTAERPTKLAILAIGYADGVLRGSHAGGSAFVRGAKCPFAIVAMDMMGIDVSNGPGVAPGDIVELLGPNRLLDDVAIAARTVPHECLVRLSHRAERVYLGEA